MAFTLSKSFSAAAKTRITNYSIPKGNLNNNLNLES